MLLFGDSTATEVRFAGFLSGGFITAMLVNPPERKLAKHTSVQCIKCNEVLISIIHTHFYID